MLNVLSAIKWSVCTTIGLVGDIYSRTHEHYTKGLVTARTISRTPNVLVQALWLNLILTRLKIKLFKWPKSLDYDSP
jgi:hypothetical protein